MIVVVLLAVIFACDNDSNPVSDEDGTSFVSLPEGYTFNSVQFISEKEGWIIGDSGIILHTSDSCKNWEQQDSGVSYDLMKMQFIDSDYGWIAGTEGVLHTSDGGQAWTEQLSDSDLWELCDIHFIDRSTGWACGTPSGIVYATSDGGNTWDITETGEHGRIISISFVDNNIGYACNAICRIFKTTDGGVTWARVESSSYAYARFAKTIYFIDEKNGFAGNSASSSSYSGAEASVYRTIDGGITWIKQIEIPKSQVISKVYFIDQVNGWAIAGNVLENEILISTQDGGKNWTEIIYNDDESILTMDFHILNDTFLYVLTSGNQIYKIYL